MSIEVRNLRKTFGGTVAVTGIDLDISEGQMLVLLGPSGCGKTTTMRCIAGLELPDSGRVLIGDKTVFDSRQGINVPVHERHVGMVFQSYAIWPHMNVFENVSFPLEMEGVARKEISERVSEMLALVGLEGFADRRASYLSGGQMQRVALARSLVMRPSVLLFDEPLSNLDARLRDHLRVQLREIQTQLRITSVYVTHDQREALALADQIVVMEAGEVRQIGDPLGLYRRPRTSMIAEFLGYSNIFDASIADRAAGSCRVVLVGSGHRLRAADTPAASGDAIAACIRPEDVAIERLDDDGSPPAELPENTVAGEVLLASFIGSHMQYRVRAASSEVWEVLSARISTHIRLGDRVLLKVPSESVHLLPKA